MTSTSSSRSPLLLLLLFSLLSLLLLTSASPLPVATPAPIPNSAAISLLWRRSQLSSSSLNAQAARDLDLLPRTDEDQASYPTFPEEITSCRVCSQNYESLNSCMEAAPLFADVSAILFNPLAFIDVIQCACTETFQAVFPQCVDCFEKTNQTYYLTSQSDTTDAGSFVTGLREVCGLASALLGGVAVANSEVYSAAATAAALDTATATATTTSDEAVVTEVPAAVSTTEEGEGGEASALATAIASSSSTSGGAQARASGYFIGYLALGLVGLVALI
ncbi:hypothetical protein BDY24DRAFT_416345 [Mrakia frigida]|uniref:uncharacterized protein n=1 Tax=Mrakia frigida TaxID=29902 RepID=UPI003FCC0783